MAPPPPPFAMPHAHPYFDDRGTLDWYTTLDEAKAAARASGKRIFVEFGRELCGQCRSLVQAVLPRPDVGPLLAEHFVGLAAEADEPEPEVEELAMRLEDAMMLPFVFFLDADGGFLDGYSGVVTPPYLLQTVRRIVGASAG